VSKKAKSDVCSLLEVWVVEYHDLQRGRDILGNNFYLIREEAIARLKSRYEYYRNRDHEYMEWRDDSNGVGFRVLASSAGSPALYLKDECRDESQVD
jgi:hypothetical protein